jgi:CheY-like chemotaxis protein
MRPDLVLLDIGLPTLNGISVARRIRDASPDSKILFLTEESSPDVAEAALEAGGAGYVVKADAGRELLVAVKAVCEGRRYISSRLVGHVFFGTPDNDPPEWHTFHKLQIYSDDASFLNGFASFIAGGLNAGNAVVALATEAHRQGLYQKLRSQRFDLDAVIRSGSYISMDVGETLSSFILGDRPDAEQFATLVNNVVEKASKDPNGAGRRVLACGECSPFLWAQGKLDTALRVEELFDAVAHKFKLSILCGYAAECLRGSEKHPIARAICSVHSSIIPYNQSSQLA